MTRPTRWYDYLTVNIYWLGLTALSQTMTPLVLPLLVQQFVGETSKGSYYGNLRLWTLMVALLVQALMGMLSDRSTLPLGRRRPFIFIGTIGVIGVLMAVGLVSGMDGIEGYWLLFMLVIFQMIFANTAHGAQQGLIPDLVPVKKHGRFSGIKAVLEVPIPVILVAFTIAPFISSGNLWGGLITLAVLLLVVMGITMFVPEPRQEKVRTPFNWQPFIRLAAMTGMFTLVILLMGLLVKTVAGLTTNLADIGFLFVTGLAGLTAMVVAVVLGVWASLRVGLGDEVKQHPSFPWWVISRLAFLIGSTNLASFVVYFLQGRFGYAQEAAAGPAATLTMFVGIFILLSAIPGGWLTDRVGRKPLLVLSGILAATGTLIVILAPSLPVVYVGGVLIGIATGQFYASNWALGTDIVPKEHAGRFLGMSNLAGAGAGAIGAYIGGPIADQITAQVPSMPGMGYLILFVIYGVLFFVSIIALRGVRERRTEETSFQVIINPKPKSVE
jgi:MFS family permease